MRIRRWVVVAVLAVLGAVGRPAYGDRPEPDPADAAIQALRSSDDATARRDAARRIVDLGLDTVERAVRRSAQLDDAAWSAFAEAVRRERGPLPLACALIAGAPEVPEAARDRVTDLAKELVPALTELRTHAEIREDVRRLLVDERDQCDREFWPWSVALRGRDAYPVVMEFVRSAEALGADRSRTHSLLALVAQREDVPELRRLLVGGNTIVAAALARLQAQGVSEAADALIAGIEAGRFDLEMSTALAGGSINSTLVRSVRGWSPNALAGRGPQRRAAAALRKWASAPDPRLSDAERARAAEVFSAFDSREDIALVERWAAECREPEPLVTMAKALVRLGSRRGVEILVRVVAAPTRPKEDAPASPGTAPAQAGPADPLAGGVPSWLQTQASTWLGDVEFESSSAVDAKLPGPQTYEPRHAKGPWYHPSGEAWTRAVPEIAAWWERVRERLGFDGASGRWRIRTE